MKQIIEKVCTAKLFEFIIQNDRKLNMEICDLTTQLNGLRECYKVLESKYTETLKELSESRKEQIDQSAVNNELSILTKKQEFEIQELKRQIYIKGLINSQGMEIFPPDR